MIGEKVAPWGLLVKIEAINDISQPTFVTKKWFLKQG